MIKLYFRIIQGITFLYLSTSGIMWGQTHLYNNTKVDSLTFVNTRKALNNLSTENYQKDIQLQRQRIALQISFTSECQ
nr:hypothetical protein [Elizabethkingia bruuniana]